MGQFWTSVISKGPQGATMKAYAVDYFFIKKVGFRSLALGIPSRTIVRKLSWCFKKFSEVTLKKVYFTRKLEAVIFSQKKT